MLNSIGALESVTSVTRISAPAGPAISIAVSQSTFPLGSNRVYLATAGDFPDALAGASLAGRNGAPVLLLSEAGVDAVTAEVERLGTTGVVVLGGPAAILFEWLLPTWNHLAGNTMPTWQDP